MFWMNIANITWFICAGFIFKIFNKLFHRFWNAIQSLKFIVPSVVKFSTKTLNLNRKVFPFSHFIKKKLLCYWYASLVIDIVTHTLFCYWYPPKKLPAHTELLKWQAVLSQYDILDVIEQKSIFRQSIYNWQFVNSE